MIGLRLYAAGAAPPEKKDPNLARAPPLPSQPRRLTPYSALMPRLSLIDNSFPWNY